MRYKTNKAETNPEIRYTINQNEQIEQWYLHRVNDDGTITLRKNRKFMLNAKLVTFKPSAVFSTLQDAYLHK